MAGRPAPRGRDKFRDNTARGDDALPGFRDVIHPDRDNVLEERYESWRDRDDFSRVHNKTERIRVKLFRERDNMPSERDNA
jgi:hypothetical protein